MRMIDLFCGAGGLSLGLESAGFHTVLAVDRYADACRTYADLFPQVDLRCQAIEEVDLRPFRGQVELLAGGPPCQPYSSGGKRLGADDQRDLLPAFLSAVETVRPPVFLMENVEGLQTGERRRYLIDLLHTVRSLGYWVDWRVLNAVDYGVPQKRRRLFIVGSRVGPFRFPLPSCGRSAQPRLPKAGDFLAAGRMIGEPNPSKVSYAKNPDLRPSPYDGHLFNGGGRPVDLEGACPTILASAGGNKTPFIDTLDEVPRYHAELMSGRPPRTGALPGGRRLTIEECALIQTFPDGTRFHGARSSQYSQIGNAVPPLLAHHLGANLARLLCYGDTDCEVLRFEERNVAVHSRYIATVAIKALVQPLQRYLAECPC